MIYRDYSRKRASGYRTSSAVVKTEAIEFLRTLNRIIGEQVPGAVSMAWKSRQTSSYMRRVHRKRAARSGTVNPLMHDTLDYMKLDPVYRQRSSRQADLGMLYQPYRKTLVPPLSHDEVHGKKSILDRMSWRAQKFANLRAYYGWMWAFPARNCCLWGNEFLPADASGTMTPARLAPAGGGDNWTTGFSVWYAISATPIATIKRCMSWILMLTALVAGG